MQMPPKDIQRMWGIARVRQNDASKDLHPTDAAVFSDRGSCTLLVVATLMSSGKCCTLRSYGLIVSQASILKLYRPL